MANLGEVPITRLSPQDRLAACIANDPRTQPGNRLPDINTLYIYQ
jgi:hypothetical protein